jgi:PQQ-dependent catabolism-associated CXXCW motif protein
VKSPADQINPDEGGGGVVFWATDTASGHPTSFFALSVLPSGGYVLNRSSGSSNYEIGSQKSFSGINGGLGAVNLIRIATRANGNSAYFNGVKAQDFSGQPEKDTLYIGLLGRSEKARKNEWRFFDLVMVAPNFADELTNFGVQAQTDLRKSGALGSATPTAIPGAHVIRTGALSDAIQNSSLDGARFLLIDALDDDHARTISGAVRMPYAGAGGNFTDDVQRRLSRELKSAAKGNLSTPVVFFCEGAQCWESYNAALRALKIGFTDVYWYRGGIFSWEQAGLPMK